MNGDAELLRRFAENGSEDAFAELVQRHLKLVHFAALRQLDGDLHRAQEVAQAVFTDLARKAAILARREVLASWLHTSTRFAAAKVRRAAARRLKHETEAETMHALERDATSVAEWERLRPLLDEVVHEMNERDRSVVLLRFFEDRPFAEIGETLGVSEDAARMRVERALEKLHGLLAKRGITSTSAALGAVLATQAAAAVPAGLAATITGSSLASAAAAGGSVGAAFHFLHFMSMTKISMGVAGIVLVAATAVTWHEQKANGVLRDEVTALRREAGAAETLRTEKAALLAEKTGVAEKTRADQEEIARLRAEVEANQKAKTAFLARQRAASTTRSAPAASSGAEELRPGMISVDAMRNAGRDSPQSAAQTILWAIQRGDIDVAAGALTFDPVERAKMDAFVATLPASVQAEYGTPERMMAFVMAGSPRPLAGVQLIDQTQPDPDTMVQHVQVEYKSGEVRQDEIKFRRGTDGWQQVISPALVDRVIAYFKAKQ